MRSSQFIRSSLLTKERKFIGLMRFPEASVGYVRNEIMRWILMREQENSRMLRLDPPQELKIGDTDRDAAGCVSSETPIGSLIEFAVSRSGDAAIRYFHHMISKDRRKVEKEGFLTTFVFRRNTVTSVDDLWMRLEYCHSSLIRTRRIDPTVPRIFRQIIDNVPDVRSVIHSGSPRADIENADSQMPTYDEIEKVVRREHRVAARQKSGTEVPGAKAPVGADLFGQVRPHQSEMFEYGVDGRVRGVADRNVQVRDSERKKVDGNAGLVKLRAAIQSLHELVVNFFNPEYKVESVRSLGKNVDEMKRCENI